MRFFARLEKLIDEGLGPWIALIGAEHMILAFHLFDAGAGMRRPGHPAGESKDGHRGQSSCARNPLR